MERCIGISEGKLRHSAEGRLPGGIYTEAEAAIIQYGQKFKKLLLIDDSTYHALRGTSRR